MRQILDWREVLKEFIIVAGTQGRSQQEITVRFRNLVLADQLRHELEVLHLEDKVQKFMVQGKAGGEKTIWRATTKINDE